MGSFLFLFQPIFNIFGEHKLFYNVMSDYAMASFPRQAIAWNREFNVLGAQGELIEPPSFYYQGEFGFMQPFIWNTFLSFLGAAKFLVCA